MKGLHQPSPSEASTVYDDELDSQSIGCSSSVCSEDNGLLVDVSLGDNQCLDILPRGWSMRRGHMKKAAKPKMGKSAIGQRFECKVRRFQKVGLRLLIV